MKPSYDDLTEVVALATALLISTRRQEESAMKDDYASLSGTLRRLHARYHDEEWTRAVIEALDRVHVREKQDMRFRL